MATRNSKRRKISNVAVGYIRRSSSKQEKSLAEQRREIETYAERQGYSIIRWYEDDAISGDVIEVRRDFQSNEVPAHGVRVQLTDEPVRTPELHEELARLQSNYAPASTPFSRRRRSRGR